MLSCLAVLPELAYFLLKSSETPKFAKSIVNLGDGIRQTRSTLYLFCLVQDSEDQFTSSLTSDDLKDQITRSD